MKKTIIAVQTIALIILKSPQKLMFTSKKEVFIENSYLKIFPILSNVSSYIQAFLGVFASSLMTINSAFIVFIFGSGTIRSASLLYCGLVLYLAAMFMYILSFATILFLRRRLISDSKKHKVEIEKVSCNAEKTVSVYIFQMTLSALFFFSSFMFLLPCLEI